MDLKSILAVMGVVWRRGQGAFPSPGYSIYPARPTPGTGEAPAVATGT